MTRSAGNLISGEVVRNKRSAQWAVAPIENAELSAKQKRLEFVGAKRAKTSLQDVFATIERTDQSFSFSIADVYCYIYKDGIRPIGAECLLLFG